EFVFRNRVPGRGFRHRDAVEVWVLGGEEILSALLEIGFELFLGGFEGGQLG
ncbi:MAG: hypothetical protein Q9200_006433, partial [Gallowayella weberi]